MKSADLARRRPSGHRTAARVSFRLVFLLSGWLAHIGGRGNFPRGAGSRTKNAQKPMAGPDSALFAGKTRKMTGLCHSRCRAGDPPSRLVPSFPAAHARKAPGHCHSIARQSLPADARTFTMALAGSQTVPPRRPSINSGIDGVAVISPLFTVAPFGVPSSLPVAERSLPSSPPPAAP